MRDFQFPGRSTVFAANAVDVRIQEGLRPTPTPAISHAILSYNQRDASRRADGVIITPSHNPPRDGGIKYNPPSGGPADTAMTTRIQDMANNYLADGLSGVRKLSFDAALSADTTFRHDYI